MASHSFDVAAPRSIRRAPGAMVSFRLTTRLSRESLKGRTRNPKPSCRLVVSSDGSWTVSQLARLLLRDVLYRVGIVSFSPRCFQVCR